MYRLRVDRNLIFYMVAVIGPLNVRILVHISYSKEFLILFGSIWSFNNCAFLFIFFVKQPSKSIHWDLGLNLG